MPARRWRAVLPLVIYVLLTAWVLVDNLNLHELHRAPTSLSEVVAELALIAALGGGLIGLELRAALSDSRLRASEARFRDLTERSPDLIYRFRYQPTFAVDYISPASISITGHAPAEFYADPGLVWRVIHPEDVSRIRTALDDPETVRVPFLVRWQRPDGSIVWTERRAVPIYESTGGLLAVEGFARDVSAWVAAEEALRASEERYRRITETLTDHVSTVRLDADTGDPAGCVAPGPGSRHAAAETEAPAGTWMIEPDDRAMVLEQEQQLLAGGLPEPLEHRVVGADGTRRWVRRVLVPHVDAGRLVAYDALLTDITAHRALQEQLRQAQKLEAVGQLAAGIAHDFNNLLTGISGFAQLAAERLPGDAEVQDDLAEIARATQRASGLTQQLLVFSRARPVEPEVMDAAVAIDGLAVLLRRLLGEHIDLEVRSPDVPALVNVDPSQFEQVVVNLAVNARDAMPDGGRLLISVDALDVPGPRCERDMPPGLAPGAYIEVSVTDSGTGMDADTRARAFDPFFTTKEPGRGTGLGLATVHGIVRQSGGHVFLESEVGRGTRVQVCLPRVEAEADPVEIRPISRYRGTGTILLAEDDASVRTFARRALERAGYRVLAAADGVEALEVAARHDASIDLLLTDLVMPQLGGSDLARRLRALRPEVAVLFVSGYAAADLAVSSDLGPFLSKPFTAAALEHAVSRALERKAAAVTPGGVVAGPAEAP